MEPIAAMRSMLKRWQWARDLKMELDVRRGKTLVPQQPLQARYEAALAVLGEDGAEPGDYLEFGVYNGSSMLSMHRALKTAGITDVRLVGFDSFEGLPAAAAVDDGGVWEPGCYRSSLEYTRRRLEREGIDWNRTHLVKGWFSNTATPQTAAALNLRKAGVIMIDCDIYSSTVDALRFCEPLIVDRAVIFFDDWHSYALAEKGQGERRAFDEFLAAHRDIEAEPFEAYGVASEAFVLMRDRTENRGSDGFVERPLQQ